MKQQFLSLPISKWKHTQANGFILPLTLFLLMIFSLMIVQIVVKYETEKRFFTATKTGYELETLLVFSVKQLNDLLKDNDLPDHGSFQMDVGYAIFETVDEADGEKTVRLDCYTFNGGHHSVWITFDPTTNRIIDWFEI